MHAGSVCCVSMYGTECLSGAMPQGCNYLVRPGARNGACVRARLRMLARVRSGLHMPRVRTCVNLAMRASVHVPARTTAKVVTRDHY